MVDHTRMPAAPRHPHTREQTHSGVSNHSCYASADKDSVHEPGASENKNWEKTRTHTKRTQRQTDTRRRGRTHARDYRGKHARLEIRLSSMSHQVTRQTKSMSDTPMHLCSICMHARAHTHTDPHTGRMHAPPPPQKHTVRETKNQRPRNHMLAIRSAAGHSGHRAMVSKHTNTHTHTHTQTRTCMHMHLCAHMTCANTRRQHQGEARLRRSRPCWPAPPRGGGGGLCIADMHIYTCIH